MTFDQACKKIGQGWIPTRQEIKRFKRTKLIKLIEVARVANNELFLDCAKKRMKFLKRLLDMAARKRAKEENQLKKLARAYRNPTWEKGREQGGNIHFVRGGLPS